MKARAAGERRGALAVPMALYASLFVGVSLLYVVGLSLMTRGEGFSAGLPLHPGNYARILSPLYLRSLLLSLRLAFLTALLCLALGYPFALFMARAKPRARAWLMMLLIVPFWTNALIRVYGWKILFSAAGPVNSVLLALGAVNRPLKLLYTDFAVLVGMVYAMFPFMVLPVYSSAERMDWGLAEASRDLGATPLKSFLTVVVPLTLPGIMAGTVLTFIPSVGLFFLSDLLGGSNTMLWGNMVHNELLKSRDLPFAAALSVVLLLLTGAVLLAYRRLGGRAESMVL
ncbi:MAG TPA: ABC transporter permease subunit [Candidatus Limnocylindria bacterium]|nr:ABC transporter permease subunit [Candidatus Limnocylindria bacterium]